MAGRFAASVMIASMILTACGGATQPGSVESTTTQPERATTTTAAPVSTTAASTTAAASPSTTAPAALDELGYPISDEYVVETIFSGLDAATGGLAMDADGVLYQADFGYSGHVGDSVYRIFPDGTIETLVQSDLMASLTMTVRAPDGTLYQSSYGSDRLFTIDGEGNVEVIAEGIRGPTGIVLADDGSVYVEAYNSDSIHKILPDGTLTDWVVDRRFNGINGLTQGPDGTLYAVDHRDGGIFSIDLDGTVEKLHTFPKPTSHVVYVDGSLFITSRGGHVVFRYDLATGDVEIIAGNGEPGTVDGRGAEAQIDRPNAIIIGPDGALYINHGTDNANNPVTIRRITHQP